MFDAVAKTDPNEVAPAAGVLLCMCPRCGEAYIAGRKDQKFCSRTCQKNASRGSRQIAESPEERRRQETRKGRIEGLSHAFYETRPAYRAEYLEKLIKEARERVELRGLVTRRPTLRSWARDKGTGRLHIAHVLDHYCQAVYGLRCFVVVNPETELPQADTLAFPSEYFGPDAPPVYEDGSLKVRPCPRATRKEPQSASTSIKGNLLGDSLRGYVRMDAGEFIEQIKAMRAARAQGLRKPTRMRLTYAEEIGMDQNINAPL